ncbi:hypothetical protein HYX06_04280 [Candidatus Woesearchaeota archaeon]|nr:hypothetical protein [Candidatus Woesearchaeota archaeon]
MTAYYRAPYTALILAAGLATALPVRNNAGIAKPNVARNSIDSIASPSIISSVSPMPYSLEEYFLKNPDFAQNQARDQILLLDSLVSRASYIFHGKVQKIEEREIELQGSQGIVKAPVSDITFDVMDVLKGTPQPSLVVTVSRVLRLEPLVGGEVLWYLGPKASTGLQAPVGGYSGDFHIIPNERGKLVVRQGGNRGLWNSENPLWSSSNERELARQYLLDRQVPIARADRIIIIGDERCCSELLPLDFILAATHTKVTASNQK